MSINLDSDGIKSIFEIVLPTKLDSLEGDHLVDIVTRASKIYQLQLSDRVLVRLLLGKDLLPLNPDANEHDDDHKLIVGLAAKLRYQAYAATMRTLAHTPLIETQWRSGSGFINDCPETRIASNQRWLSILRSGWHIGDSVNLENQLDRWNIHDIDPRCMVGISSGSNKAKITPSRLKTDFY